MMGKEILIYDFTKPNLESVAGNSNKRYKDNSLLVDSESNSFNFYTNDFKIQPARIAEFAKRKGFIRISEDGNDSLTIIKNDNKILIPYNFRTDYTSFLKDHIQHPEQRTEIENQLVAKENDILKSWKLLKGEVYNLHKDKKDTVYIPFKNAVAKISKNSVSLIEYSSNEIGLFIEVDSQKHLFNTFNIDNRSIGQFEEFLTYAVIGKATKSLTASEIRTFQAFKSMIGYLVSNYKNPAQSPAIILTDNGADDESRNGGRGKSLLTMALQKVRGFNKRGGNEFDPGYRHSFADLQKYHDIYILDDVPAGFNYDSLYTQITGDIAAERKGTQAVIIPFKDSPKFVITTNYAVRYDVDAASTNRRFLEYKFSDFWNKENTPDKFFNSTFFYDWNDEEWQMFFEFLVSCVIQFLSNGLTPIAYEKDADNFRAYFSNSVIDNEMERIMSEFKKVSQFSVTDFLDEHEKKEIFRYKKLFNHNNAKTRIDVWIEFHKLNWIYDKRTKKWKATNESGETDMPF